MADRNFEETNEFEEDDIKIDYAPWLDMSQFDDLPKGMRDFLYEEMSDWGAGN